MTPVTVLRNRYVRGFPKHDEGERTYVLDLSQALARTYRTDAHFAAYATPCARRLSRDAVDQLPHVALTTAVVDVDCPAVHGTDEPAPPLWRQQLLERFVAMRADHPGGYLYGTRGGARIVYRQATPTLLTCGRDAQEWRKAYAVLLAYLQRRYDIAGDHACGDWQRLFRLPRATRDAGKPEAWGAIGDPSAIGSLAIEASADDVAAARAASKAFRARREVDLSGVSGAADGFGVLYYALQAQGAVGRQLSGCSYAIRCPNEAQHTTGQTGDGSTVLYLPDGAGQELGTIHCMHSHCAGFGPREWVRFFGSADLSAARVRAGINREGRAA